MDRRWLSALHRRHLPSSADVSNIADRACERIAAAITASLVGERPIKAALAPYNPIGSTAHVNFTTSKKPRFQTDPRRCHVNRVVCDSDWEAEFCRVPERNPRVQAYAKNLALRCRTCSARHRKIPARLHRKGRGRAWRHRSVEPRSRDQGLSWRGREGQGQYDGRLLGARGQQSRVVWPLGLCRTQGIGVRDCRQF